MENIKSNLFQELKKYSWWVQWVLGHDIPPEAKNLLVRLDDVGLWLEKDSENAAVLREKIKFISQEEKNYDGIGWRNISNADAEKHAQLFELFVELAVCDILSKRGFLNIKLLPEQKLKKIKQPDIKAERDGEPFFFEAKRIRRPVFEASTLRTAGMLSNYARDDFREGIKKKIDYFANDADEKFKAANVPEGKRTLILDYEPGIDAIVDLEGGDGQKLERVLGKGYFVALEKQYGMKIEILDFDF